MRFCATEGVILSGADNAECYLDIFRIAAMAGLQTDGTLEKLIKFFCMSAEGESARRESLRQKDKVFSSLEHIESVFLFSWEYYSFILDIEEASCF